MLSCKQLHPQHIGCIDMNGEDSKQSQAQSMGHRMGDRHRLVYLGEGEAGFDSLGVRMLWERIHSGHEVQVHGPRKHGSLREGGIGAGHGGYVPGEGRCRLRGPLRGPSHIKLESLTSRGDSPVQTVMTSPRVEKCQHIFSSL